MKISVIGLGKAGLPLAAVIADSGQDVIGVDLDESRVEMINNGNNPIEEEFGLGELISKYCGNKLIATSDPEYAAINSKVHIIIVPLLIGQDNNPDFSIIEKALENLGKGLKKEDVVVLETTVPPKTTETLIKDRLEKYSNLRAGEDFYLAYSPERIMTGYSISRFKEFPKLVGGINNISTEKAFEIYQKFSSPVKVSNSRTAELAKVSEGVFRDVNIALANELYKVSESYEIDFWELKNAANHRFCNIHEPGNVGGHCIPVYPWFLINNLDVPLVKKARELNDSMLNYYVEKIDTILSQNGKKNSNAKIGIVGLSYREGVKEDQFSRSVDLIKILTDKGYKLQGYDPLFSNEDINNLFQIEPILNYEDLDVIIIMNKETSLKGKLIEFKHKVVDVKNSLMS
tara:strand:- start:7128 stop:8333 length:1206 start_codon:yes stop_codon:yes gene_type:complete